MRLTCARMSFIMLRISKRRSHNSIAPEPVCWTQGRVSSNTSATECSHQMTRWASRIYEVDPTTWLCEARRESLASRLSPGPRERKTVTNLVYQIFANLSDLIINFDLMNQNISAFICIQSIIKYLSFYKLLCNITFVLWSKINYLSYHFCWYWKIK